MTGKTIERAWSKLTAEQQKAVLRRTPSVKRITALAKQAHEIVLEGLREDYPDSNLMHFRELGGIAQEGLAEFTFYVYAYCLAQGVLEEAKRAAVGKAGQVGAEGIAKAAQTEESEQHERLRRNSCN